MDESSSLGVRHRPALHSGHQGGILGGQGQAGAVGEIIDTGLDPFGVEGAEVLLGLGAVAAVLGEGRPRGQREDGHRKRREQRDEGKPEVDGDGPARLARELRRRSPGPVADPRNPVAWALAAQATRRCS